MEEGGGIERVFFDILPKLSYNADTMINKVLKYVEKYRMIEPGDTIAAGVSGGADSVCLLFILLEIRRRIPFFLRAVHINHGIRPDAARDACYVRELCARQNIPFWRIFYTRPSIFLRERRPPPRSILNEESLRVYIREVRQPARRCVPDSGGRRSGRWRRLGADHG